MSAASEDSPTPPTTPPTVREQEQADEDKTADSAPAPVHDPRERKVLVRDAYGNDPAGDPTGPDGVRGPDEVGEAPHERPDPLVDAWRDVEKARSGDA